MRKSILLAAIGFLLFWGLCVYACAGSLEEPRPAQTPVQAPAQTPAQPIEFAKLEITNVAYQGGEVKVTGVTDLPDGSQISVTLDIIYEHPETDTYIGVNTKVNSENGKFVAVLMPPNRPEFKKGPYVVEALFTPKGQPDAVLKLVGKNGENLAGDKVEKAYGFKIMETSYQTDLKLGITSYPMVNVNSYPPNSPERAFAEFLNAWKNQDWDAMVKFTQKTWRSGEKNPAEWLSFNIGIKDLLGAEILNKNTISDVMVDINVKVYYALGNEVGDETRVVRIVREIDAYKPSTQGEWSVNPISALRIIK
jgi:hypothetical protein